MGDVIVLHCIVIHLWEEKDSETISRRDISRYTKCNNNARLSRSLIEHRGRLGAWGNRKLKVLVNRGESAEMLQEVEANLSSTFQSSEVFLVMMWRTSRRCYI